MKTLSAKRIAAVVTGAALLGIGLAFAGPITFQNVPIINNGGQPVVQIVIGSTAQPWDGVTAGNIAAAVGNLAYTSVPVTASVNAAQAQSVLHVSVSSPKYTLSNQQVWLNESGSVGQAAGTYLFSALIGSVLNGAVVLNSPQNTKNLQGTGQYAFPHSTSIAISPLASPYTAAGNPPTGTSITAGSNGGGVSFSSFTLNNNDNIMQITNSQYSGLLSSQGGNSETSYLWLTGYPVFDQGNSGSLVNQFMWMDAAGAVQYTFGSPIQNSISNGQVQINAPIQLLGKNWTIITAVGPSSTVTSSTTVNGGKIQLASSLIPLTTVYVGHNITSGPWTVQLTDLGQPNQNGVSPASLSILYNNVLTNTSSITPGSGTTKFNVTGHTLYVSVNQTFAGLYAYQKWAKIQLYTNVYNISDGKVFNQTTNPGYYVNLLWTNTTSSTAAKAKALQSIIIYNTTPQNLAPGQSFTFIQNPQAIKATFVGDTLGTSQLDSVTLQTSSAGTVQYQSQPGGASANPNNIPGLGITNITEPASELTLTSQIPNAFSYVGQTGTSVLYDLTPYKLTETGNNIQAATASSAATGLAVSNTVVNLNFALGSGGASWISATNPLTVYVYYATAAGGNIQSQSATFTTNTATMVLGTNAFNVTDIKLSRALPPANTFSVTVNAPNANTPANTVLLATLQATGVPGVLYSLTNQNFDALSTTATGNTIYNQQNGQPTNTLVLTQSTTPAGTGSTGIGQYFTFTMGEQPVPSNTVAVDVFTVCIDNSSAGVVASPIFQLNYSVAADNFHSGTKNNATYITNTQGTASTYTVQQGFRTEKGSKLVSITPSLVTFNFAKAQDWLQFVISPANSNTSVTKSYKSYGPYSVGQATNIANVTIGKVSANISLSSTNYSITGINNITATPSVTSASTPVLLSNLTTTPLVVLDSQANPGSNLILIGSGYVNSLSKQLQNSYNITVSPGSQPIVQAYGTNRVLIAGYYANQTNAAGNSFIQQLYAQAQ